MSYYLIIALYMVVLAGVCAIAASALPDTAAALFGSPVSGQTTGFLLLTLPVILYFALLKPSPRQAIWGKRRKGLKVTDTI